MKTTSIKRASRVTSSIQRVWTYGYRPFVMGGSVNYILACDVECTGPHDLGKGYKGYLVTAPNGKTFVAESKTGALVGPTLEDVRTDIQNTSVAVMRKQVADAAQEMKDAREHGSFEVHDRGFFWSALKAL